MRARIYQGPGSPATTARVAFPKHPMAPSPACSIVSLNEEAVAHLGNDEFHDAVTKLTRGLSSIQAQLLQDSGNTEHSAGEAAGTTGTTCASIVDASEAEAFLVTNVPLGNRTESTEVLAGCRDRDSEITLPMSNLAHHQVGPDPINLDTPYFAQAFCLTDRDSSSRQHPFRTQTLASILLYNLGVAFHQMGSQGDSNCHYLRNALFFYGRASQAICGSGPKSLTKTTTTLYLALCINTAHIQQQFFNFPQVEELYNHFNAVFNSTAANWLTREERYSLSIISWYGNMNSGLPSPAA